MAASGVAPGVFLNPLPPSGPPRLHQPDPLEPDPCPTWTASGPGVEGPRGRYPDQAGLWGNPVHGADGQPSACRARHADHRPTEKRQRHCRRYVGYDAADLGVQPRPPDQIT
jgi:hypothetical protein